jgi:peroxiredoxin
MIRHPHTGLVPGKPFPNLDLKLLSGERIVFPGRSGGKLTALLIYCGESCRACRQQLIELEKMIHKGHEHDLRIVAASGDDREHAARTMWDLNITFPIAYGLDAAQIAEGSAEAHHGDEPGIYGSGFLLDTEGKVVNAFYGPGECWSQRFHTIDWLKLTASAKS